MRERHECLAAFAKRQTVEIARECGIRNGTDAGLQASSVGDQTRNELADSRFNIRFGTAFGLWSGRSVQGMPRF
jgi:hypothetical protein